jgi:hypothetical protein
MPVLIVMMNHLGDVSRSLPKVCRTAPTRE